MTSNVRNWQLRCVGSVRPVAAGDDLDGGRANADGRPKSDQYDPNAQTVEMFAAIEKGDIAVKLIPKDSTQCQVLIENKTDKPLNVKLPEAFAGVPVLAQNAGRRRRRRRTAAAAAAAATSSSNQGMGGGMGGMGGDGRRHVQRPAGTGRKIQSPHRLPRSRQSGAARRRPLRNQAHRELHHQARRPRVVRDAWQRPDRAAARLKPRPGT